MYLRDKVSQKHSKEQFESAQRIEQDYSKYFTGVRRTHLHADARGHDVSCVICVGAVLMQVWSRPAVCPARALRSWPWWSRSRTKSCGFPTEAREESPATEERTSFTFVTPPRCCNAPPGRVALSSHLKRSVSERLKDSSLLNVPFNVHVDVGVSPGAERTLRARTRAASRLRPSAHVVLRVYRADVSECLTSRICPRAGPVPSADRRVKGFIHPKVNLLSSSSGAV